MEKVVKYVQKIKAAQKTVIRNMKVTLTRRVHEWMIQ